MEQALTTLLLKAMPLVVLPLIPALADRSADLECLGVQQVSITTVVVYLLAKGTADADTDGAAPVTLTVRQG